MSQVVDLCEGSGSDNGKWSNTASVPSLPLLRKRTRYQEETCSDVPDRNKNAPGNKNATVSAGSVVDLELTVKWKLRRIESDVVLQKVKEVQRRIQKEHV